MSQVVSLPERRHHCGPNEYGEWMGYEWDAQGTVRACEECGRTWVAYNLPPGRRMHVVITLWRREGRLARWWRERRAR